MQWLWLWHLEDFRRFLASMHYAQAHVVSCYMTFLSTHKLLKSYISLLTANIVCFFKRPFHHGHKILIKNFNDFSIHQQLPNFLSSLSYFDLIYMNLSLLLPLKPLEFCLTQKINLKRILESKTHVETLILRLSKHLYNEVWKCLQNIAFRSFNSAI